MCVHYENGVCSDANRCTGYGHIRRAYNSHRDSHIPLKKCEAYSSEEKDPLSDNELRGLVAVVSSTKKTNFFRRK